METNEIINLILSIVTIMLSVIAVIISICVSNKQNKIALFEKRMEVFSVADKLVLLGEQMRSEQMSMKDYSIECFFEVLSIVFSEGQTHTITEEDANKLNFYISGVIDSSNFLFKKPIVDDLKSIHRKLVEIENKRNSPDVMKYVSAFSSATIKFSKNNMRKMEKTIKL